MDKYYLEYSYGTWNLMRLSMGTTVPQTLASGSSIEQLLEQARYNGLTLTLPLAQK